MEWILYLYENSRKNQPCWHFDFRLPASVSLREQTSAVFPPAHLWYFVTAAIGISYTWLESLTLTRRRIVKSHLIPWNNGGKDPMFRWECKFYIDFTGRGNGCDGYYLCLPGAPSALPLLPHPATLGIDLVTVREVGWTKLSQSQYASLQPYWLVKALNGSN